MKKLFLCLSAVLICSGLCACDGTGFDPAAFEQASKSIADASKTMEQVTESFGEIEKNVSMITESMQQGVNSTNDFMEWYKNDAIPDNPWIKPPITNEEVENAIRAGQNVLMAYIEQNVDKNSSYNILSEEEEDFFTEYFKDESINGFLLSTYEKPEDCNAYEALSRDSGIIKKVKSSEKEEAEGKILRKDVDSALEAALGIDSDALTRPLEYKTYSDKEYVYIDEVKDCEKLICKGGFYYNNLYVVMMKEEDADSPFALSVLSKDSDDKVRVYVNYWSDNLENVDWNGSVIFGLYNQILNSDFRAVMSIPGAGGDITLGAALDAVGGLKGKNIDKALELVSDEGDKIKTYMQEFDGYDVYYSDIDPKAVGEFVVSQIDVTDGDFKTAEGIGIGTGIETIKNTYGEGIEAMISGGRKQLMYEMGKYNMLFILDKAGKVSEMTIFLADDALSE
ncbi:MAG: hypothetical protein IJT37_09050 [Lachnospiraceae bacterium]|nr:hypothetical protein [Lachnospiraceae bacterium]